MILEMISKATPSFINLYLRKQHPEEQLRYGKVRNDSILCEHLVNIKGNINSIVIEDTFDRQELDDTLQCFRPSITSGKTRFRWIDFFAPGGRIRQCSGPFHAGDAFEDFRRFQIADSCQVFAPIATALRQSFRAPLDNPARGRRRWPAAETDGIVDETSSVIAIHLTA
jgi:hypothetical protein